MFVAYCILYIYFRMIAVFRLTCMKDYRCLLVWFGELCLSCCLQIAAFFSLLVSFYRYGVAPDHAGNLIVFLHKML